MNIANQSKNTFDFYIVNTPRHWWISQAMASHFRRPAVLLIFEGFKGAKTLYKLASSQDDSPFSNVVLVPGKLSGQDKAWLVAKLYRRFEWLRAKRCLRTIVSQCPPARVLTANVNSVHIQYLHALSVKNNNAVEFHVLDDGLQSYHAETRNPKSSLSLWYASMTHGFRLQSAPKNTLLPFFSDAWFFNPDLIDRRFRHLNNHCLPPGWFESDYVQKIRDLALSEFGLNLPAWNHPKIVFVFTKLSLLEAHCKNFDQAEFERRIGEFVQSQDGSKYALWVKYHPREPEEDVFQLKKKFDTIQFVPATLPFELLAGSLCSEDMVVGEQSTVLFDVAVNRPDVTVYSLGCAEQGTDIGALFERAGVARFA